MAKAAFEVDWEEWAALYEEIQEALAETRELDAESGQVVFPDVFYCPLCGAPSFSELPWPCVDPPHPQRGAG